MMREPFACFFVSPFARSANLRAIDSGEPGDCVTPRAARVDVIVEQVRCDHGLFCAAVFGEIEWNGKKDVCPSFGDARTPMTSGKSSECVDCC
jgi:hypothetical protein